MEKETSHMAMNILETLEEVIEMRKDLRMFKEINISRAKLNAVYVEALKDLELFNLHSDSLVSLQESNTFPADTCRDDKMLAFLDWCETPGNVKLLAKLCERLENDLELVVVLADDIIRSASHISGSASRDISTRITNEMIEMKDKTTGYQARIRRLREVYSHYIQSTEE